MRGFKKGVQRVLGVKRTEINGEKFASQREASRWWQLQQLQKAGQIADLERQVPIRLMGQHGPIQTKTGRTMLYVADFTYLDKVTGKKVIEDAKGHPTEVYQMKRAILKAMGITVFEV
jgi:hypothetical protein